MPPVDDVPVITAPITGGVSESDLTIGAIASSGTVSVDYGNDGPGSLVPNGSLTVTGNSTVANGVSSDGNLVTFVQTGDGYIGYYGGSSHLDPAATIVLTFSINPTSGAYSYTQNEPLDHSDTGSASEGITLAFGVTAIDSDGDQTPATVDITVSDSGPATITDSMTVVGGATTPIDLLDNDDLGGDGGTVTSVTINGVQHAISASGSTVIPVSFGSSQGTLTLSADGTGSYAADLGSSGFDFSYVVTDGDGDTATGSAALCYCAGTRIRTAHGETCVEDLAIGDHVERLDGTLVPVKWVGRQSISARFGAAERLQPVRFAAGSLGGGLPHTDLTVTADHGMLIDGVICQAGALVNGSTIIRVPLAEMGETFCVYHIETEAHEIILANGAPSETFIDNVSRRAFDNFAEFEALYGDVPEMEELPYPRAMSVRQIPQPIQKALGINIFTETHAVRLCS